MTAPQAAAHTDLESSSPGADATLAGLPPRVTLTFSDPMTEKYAKVAVTTADGTSAAQGKPQVSGQQVTLALNSTASGRYTVGYRVVSADGHPVSGSYTFTVKERTAAARSASPPVQVPSPAPAPESPKAAAANESDGGGSGATVLLVGGTGALVVAVGAASVFATRRRRVRRGD
ncbi:copper resistance CopC family protein [Streptomyces sp. NPDC052535]|uniref:copper resistance CopC family protein n=1 Tax=Streptomyces sp. NPDC052535 TaxID=3155531 RepID=UPI0034384339